MATPFITYSFLHNRISCNCNAWAGDNLTALGMLSLYIYYSI